MDTLGKVAPLREALKARQTRRTPLAREPTAHAEVDVRQINPRQVYRKAGEAAAGWRTQLTAGDPQQWLRENLVGPLMLTPVEASTTSPAKPGWSGCWSANAAFQRMWRARRDSNLRPSA